MRAGVTEASGKEKMTTCFLCSYTKTDANSIKLTFFFNSVAKSAVVNHFLKTHPFLVSVALSDMEFETALNPSIC